MGEGKGCARGKGEAPMRLPTIYRAKGEGGLSLAPSSKEGCGQGGVLPPQGTSEVPSPFRTLLLSYLLRMGLLGLVPLAHIGQGAPPTAHVAPRGRWTPGPLSALPVQYR